MALASRSTLTQDSEATEPTTDPVVDLAPKGEPQISKRRGSCDHKVLKWLSVLVEWEINFRDLKKEFSMIRPVLET